MIKKTKTFERLLESILFGKKFLHETDDAADFTHARYDAGENTELDHAAVQYNDLYTIYMELYEATQGHVVAIERELLPAFDVIAQQAGVAVSKIINLRGLVQRKNTALDNAKGAVEKLEAALETLGIDHADSKLDGEVAKVKKHITDLETETKSKAEEIKKLKKDHEEETKRQKDKDKDTEYTYMYEQYMYELMISDYEELVRRIDLERRRALKLLEIANIRLKGRRTGSAWKRDGGRTRIERKRAYDAYRRARERPPEDDDIPF